MFGYVMVDKANMFMKDFYLYKAFYCGLCKSIGKKYGQFMRFTTNYDITFLNVLYHAVENKEIEISNESCVLNPVQKKSIVKGNDLVENIIDINTIMMHYKCIDDVVDSKSSGKKFLDNTIIKRRYIKSSKKYPKVDEIFKKGYEKLRKLEKENSGSYDMVADCFASMLKNTTKELFQDKYTDAIGDLMYSIGKWVYIIDAIDDIDKDYKSKEYNMFLVNYDYKDKETFLKDKHDELDFLIKNVLVTMSDAFDQIKVEKYDGILTNVIWYGIPAQSIDILGGKKCKKNNQIALPK